MNSAPVAEAPSSEELRRYRDGTLDLGRFEVVDRWIAGRSPEEQERLLSGEAEAGALSGASAVLGDEKPCRFMPEPAPMRRYRAGNCIGSGGMGIVETLFDESLGREVAIKRCRPRRPDESLALYTARLRVFRREAQMTAQLEHPGIVPVHDVGIGPYGEPAFSMKRLEGEPLTALVERRRAGEQADLARVVELTLRIAEAVAYAHRRGIVHRDLKPDNVIVGGLGAAYVIDWGLAGRIGAAPPANEPGSGEQPPERFSEHGLGTPAWMAPEQFGGAAADPRMDVFGLGGLLMALLTGYGPRDLVPAPAGGRLRADRIDLAPLAARGLPRGLVAVARRCLQLAPEARYPDGAAVADDLRQWLSAGLTSAERPGPLAKARAALKRSPLLRSALVAVVLAASIVAAGFAKLRYDWRQEDQRDRAEAAADIGRIEEESQGSLDLDDLKEYHRRVDHILERHPDLESAVQLAAKLKWAKKLAQQQVQRDRLRDLARSYQIHGPWPSEAQEIADYLRLMGLRLLPDSVDADASRLRANPCYLDMLAALVQLQRAALLGSPVSPSPGEMVPALIEQAAPDEKWEALARLLRNRPRESDLDLTLPENVDAETAAKSAVTADLMLANFGPDAALLRLAEQRIEDDPGAFWPRVVAARAALKLPDRTAAERHALVALGRQEHSIWPHLILAYVALYNEDGEEILDNVLAVEDINRDHLELKALKAAALAMLGRKDEAQALIDSCQDVGELRYHLLTRTRHPLDRVARVLDENGVRIPATNPVLHAPAPSAPPATAPNASSGEAASNDKPAPATTPAADAPTPPTAAPIATPPETNDTAPATTPDAAR